MDIKMKKNRLAKELEWEEKITKTLERRSKNHYDLLSLHYSQGCYCLIDYSGTVVSKYYKRIESIAKKVEDMLLEGN